MKRRRILLLFFTFLVVLLGSTYTVLRYTGASRAFVEQTLARFIRGDFRLVDAQVNPTTGKVTLTGFRIGHPRQQQALLEAGNVELDISTNPLREVGTVRRVRIENLHLNLNLIAGQQIALREILELPEVREVGGHASEGDLPAIQIANSRITLQLVPGAPPASFEQVELELLPEAADGQHLVLSGSMVSRGGHRIDISGTADRRKGEFRALLETRDVDLVPEIANAYSPALQTYLEEAGLSGLAKKISLWVEFPTEGPGKEPSIGGGLGIEVEDIACELPDLPYPIRGASGKVSATTRGGGTVKFEIGKRGADGDLLTRGVLTECLRADRPRVDLQLTGEGLLINKPLAKAVRSLPVARAVWDGLAPNAGRVDVDLRLRDVAGRDSPELSMDLTLQGAAVTFVGFADDEGKRPLAFPYALEDVRGLVQLRADTLHLRDIRGSRADGGKLHLDGFVRGIGGDQEQTELELDIEGRDIEFSDELRQALQVLDPEFAGHYDTYSPSGHGDVDVVLRRRAGQQTSARIGIRPLAASASFAGFPYRIRQIRGRVDITEQGVTLALLGQREDAIVHLDGRFLADDPGEGLRSELWIKGESVRFDAELQTALATLDANTRDHWQMLSPEGSADCEVTLWRDSGAQDFSYDVRFDLLDCKATLERFQVPLERLRGSVFLHGTGATSRADISMVRGIVANDPDAEPARLLIQGKIIAEGPRQQQDLTAVVHGLQLTERLSIALDRSGALRRSAWRVLRPDGHVGVVIRQRKAADQEMPTQDLRVQLRDVSSNAAILPAPATKLNGEVVVQDGEVRFEDVRGLVGAAKVVCTSGSVRHVGDASEVKATITADDFPVDDNLANLMTGPLRQAYLGRNVRGAVKVNALSMTYRFPDRGDDFQVDFDGQLVAKNVSLLLAARVQEMNGIWNVEAARVTPDGGSIAGNTTDLSFAVLGHRVSRLSSGFAADARQVTFTDLDLRLHGGRVGSEPSDRAGLTYRFDGPGELEMHVAWDGMSLREFMLANGQLHSSLWGTMAGRLDLQRLTGNDLVDMQAAAELRIGGGRLGPVPLFSTIYAYLEPDKRPQFDRARVALRIGDRKVAIESLELSSSLVSVNGEGSVSMDGYVDMVMFFPDLFGETPEWLLLPRVFSFLTESVVRFHVYGYLRSPRARPRWLWQGTPGRRPIEPIPPHARRR